MSRRVAVTYSERRVIRDGVTWLFMAERYGRTTTLFALKWQGTRYLTVHTIIL